jgi:hypothetical protein
VLFLLFSLSTIIGVRHPLFTKGKGLQHDAEERAQVCID